MSDRKIVKKEHDLILAKNTWSELEGKLFATLIKELNPKNEDDFKMMEIRIDELESLWGVQLHITRLRNTCNMLTSKSYEIPEFKENGDVKEYLYINLFHQIKYNLEEKTIKFQFHELIKPYILNFSKKYVKYNIDNILSFRNKYSISFYEFFKYNSDFKKESLKTEIMTLEYLREWLQLPKSYGLYGNLKAKILKKVSEDLKKHSDIYMNFEPIKTNKKITHVSFSYGQNVSEPERKSSFFTKEEMELENQQYLNKPFLYDGQILEIKVLTHMTDFYVATYSNGENSKIYDLKKLAKLIKAFKG